MLFSIFFFFLLFFHFHSLRFVPITSGYSHYSFIHSMFYFSGRVHLFTRLSYISTPKYRLFYFMHFAKILPVFIYVWLSIPFHNAIVCVGCKIPKLSFHLLYNLLVKNKNFFFFVLPFFVSIVYGSWIRFFFSLSPLSSRFGKICHQNTNSSNTSLSAFHKNHDNSFIPMKLFLFVHLIPSQLSLQHTFSIHLTFTVWHRSSTTHNTKWRWNICSKCVHTHTHTHTPFGYSLSARSYTKYLYYRIANS